MPKKRRKTIDIDLVINVMNDYLKAQHTSIESRKGVITVIENILLSSGCYMGFRHLNEHDVPDNVTPGIRIAGYEQGSTIPIFECVDKTRRQYF